MIIRGNTTGAPRPNWYQSDTSKPDYIKGKETVDEAIRATQEAADYAQNAADDAQTTADDALTAAGDAQAAADDAMTAAEDAMGVAVEKTSVVTETVTLLAAGWVNNECSTQVRIIEDNQPTAIFVSPEPTAENYAEYTECGVRCIENLGDGLKFACDAEPSISLTIHVVAFV